MRIILASKSPRRRELLTAAGIDKYEIIPSECEIPAEEGVPPEDMVKLIAGGKAEEVSAKCSPDDIIIAADTLVYLDGAPLGKPKDENDAKAMLRALSGRCHTVFTGIAVFRGEKRLRDAVGTNVYFRELSEAEIDAYVASGEPMDKAGAYGIQGMGSLLAEKIEGEYSNVVGLPMCRLGKMLKDVGFSVLG